MTKKGLVFIKLTFFLCVHENMAGKTIVIAYEKKHKLLCIFICKYIDAFCLMQKL